MTNAKKRILGLVGAAAGCAILAALAGLARLVWDELRGVASPAWLPEWSIKGLAAGVVIGMVVEGWRKHPLLALKTMAAAIAMCGSGLYIWVRVLPELGVGSVEVSRVALAAGGFLACALLASILGSVAEGEPLVAVRPGPFGIALTEEERRGRRPDDAHRRYQLVVPLGDGADGQRLREGVDRAAERAGKSVRVWATEALRTAAGDSASSSEELGSVKAVM